MKLSKKKIEPNQDQKDPESLGRKIKNMRLSVGIHLPGLTLTSVDAEKHQCEMTQEQNCVRIKKGDYEKLVYIGNLIEAELYPID